MSREPLSASLEAVRRLAVTKQHLAGRRPSRVTTDAMVSLVRDLGYVQWDPVSIVAPSHLISFWARIDRFRPEQLDRLLWREKRLFQHWTPMASLVLTEDYPLFRSLMDRYPDSLSSSWGRQRDEARRFLAGHGALQRRVLAELAAGPLRLSEFEDHARTRRDDGDWTPGSEVEHMLFHLLMRGKVMIVGHRGNQNLWGLADRFLPVFADRKALSAEEFEREAAQRAIRALGTATPREITRYFVRGQYQHLPATLARLQEAAKIHRVVVEGLGRRDERYIHDEDLALLGSIQNGAWTPRMSLLPPFDNMLGDSARTSRLFGFDYIREQFLPAEKRRFGTYVLPILWGERFIGRIDPRLDKTTGTLVINAIHAEPGAPQGAEVAERIGRTIARFAEFVGAGRVTYPSHIPAAWKGSLG